MTFNSFNYLLFLPLVFLVYVMLPSRLRWVWLLFASLAFYACLQVPYLLAVLIGVTIVSFVSGNRIHASSSSQAKMFWLWGGIAANLSLLIWMKYIPFVAENINILFKLLSLNTQVSLSEKLVSIGVSFYVFQGISYLADIYLEIEEPERHWGRFALYMCFFPRLLQGPIERAGNLLPQLKTMETPSLADVNAAVNLILWGCFKKVVIADRLSVFVDVVYHDVHHYTGLPLIIATYLYALQIYFDFSGYTDMALGSARFFDVRLTQNFNSPYLANSVADFWRRWHISFSRWIFDYIFKPLQMNLRDWHKWCTPVALIITFLVSGLWHGATWCFILWGLIHGIYLSASTLYKPLQKRIYKKLGIAHNKAMTIWQVFVTFHLVCLAWVFFRANSISDAFYIMIRAVTGLPSSIASVLNDSASWSSQIFLRQSTGDTILALALLGLAAVMGFMERSKLGAPKQMGELAWIGKLSLWGRVTVYAVLFYLLAFHGTPSQGFAYTQF
jgi:alginate O-acetyltransferase complex protein AlgI